MKLTDHYSDFHALIDEVISEKNSPQMTRVLNPSDTALLKNTRCFGLKEDKVSGLLTACPWVGIVVLLPSLPSVYQWRQALAWGYTAKREGGNRSDYWQVQGLNVEPNVARLRSWRGPFDRMKNFGRLDLIWLEEINRGKLCITSLTPEHPFPFFHSLWAALRLENQVLSTGSERFFTNLFHKTETFKGWKYWRCLSHHAKHIFLTWLVSFGFPLRFKRHICLWVWTTYAL